MYATAHRVVSPTTGAEGINAFHYLHEGLTWNGPPPPDLRPESNPGTLDNDSVSVPPPGNRVRSYLDVVAPDGTSPASIEQAIAEAISSEVPDSFPATWNVGCFWIRFGLERVLVPFWRHELKQLVQHLTALLEGSGQDGSHASPPSPTYM